MANNKKYNLLEEISHCSGYDIALMTTFNFDIKFFERAILNPLYARGLKKISVFVDSRELSKSVKNVSNCHLGRKYMVNPVEMDGSFHPKVVLLLGKKKAKLFVGSANLTASGQTTNNEVFNFYDYSSKSQENIDVINDAISFFIEINNLSYKQDTELIREAASYPYYKKNTSSDSVLIYNTKKSILDQLKERITQRVKEINVVVPYYDQQLTALKLLKKSFPNAKAHLYLYKYLSTFPTDVDNKERIADTIDVFEGFEDNNSYSWNNFYHGKVFLFKCDNADYVLYGSANCTQSALVKSKVDNGNIECDCFEKGAKGEFDNFLDNLYLSEDDDYTSTPLTYEKEPDNNFVFRYGKYEDGIKLYIGYRKKKEDIVANIGELELDSEYMDSELIVSISSETAQQLPTVFDVELSYGNCTEMLRCWFYIPSELDGNRYSMLMTNTLDDVDIDSSGDKFAEDYTKLIDAMNSCAADIEETIRNNAMRKILQQEIEGDDTPESEDGDDFVIEDTLSDVDRFEYRRFDAVDRFRKQFLKRFLFGQSSIFPVSRNGNNAHKKSSGTDDDSEEKKPRKATTAEKRFERFVKRRIRDLFNPAYLEIISVEHFIGIMEVVFEIFKKYSNTDPVEDIFETDYVISTRIEFYKHLLNKDLQDTDNLSNLEETVITNCFTTIIENWEVGNTEQTEYANRAFLNLIEKKYQLRDSFGDYIYKALERNEVAVLKVGYKKSCDYIDMLYGYKSINLLVEAISKKYQDSDVEIKDNALKIEARVTNINLYGIPDKDVLAEISRYASKYGPVTIVNIEFINVADVRMVPNIRMRIKHRIRMETHQWTRETHYKDGSVDKSKARYIDF